MGMTLAYDATYARVIINATNLETSAALVERSTNQVTWTAVRGGAARTVDGAGTMVQLYDYEFSPNVANYYRVTTSLFRLLTDSYNRTISLGFGLADSGQIYFPANVGADYRVDGARGIITPTTTASQRQEVADVLVGDDVRIRGKFRINALPPTDDVEVGLVMHYSDLFNALHAVLRVSDTGAMTLILRKIVANVSTDLATVVASGTFAAGVDYYLQAEHSSTAGQMHIKLWAAANPEPGVYMANAPLTGPQPPDAGHKYGPMFVNHSSTFTVSAQWDDLRVTQLSPGSVSSSITPTIDGPWLKSVTRPFLNRPITVVTDATVTVARPARSSVSDVVGRTMPVGVTDLRGSRRQTVRVRTETAEETQTMEFIVASGDFYFFQAPPGMRSVPTGYFLAGDVDESWHVLRENVCTFTLPLTEVAAPGPYVVAAETTWAAVLATYATWAALLADNPTWADLLARRANPATVIVP